MKNAKPSALPASIMKRDPDEPLPQGFELPKNMVKLRRKLKGGGQSDRILYRVPKDLRQPREGDGKPRLLSWKFPWTYGGLVAADSKQRSQEPHLREAKAEAARKSSRFYVPMVQQATEDYLADRERCGMRSLSDRKRDMRTLAKKCGHMLVPTVTHHEVQAILNAEADRGLSFESVSRLRMSIQALFTWLFKRDKVQSRDFMMKTFVPEHAKRDSRQRELLTDAEQMQLFKCADVPQRYRAEYVMARYVGGPRRSDSHAITWGMVDTESWKWCDVPRPKTDKPGDPPTRIELEPLPAQVLKEWFLASGRPSPAKHLFPRQRPGRKDDPSKGLGVGEAIKYPGSSYARRLRRHLKLAGVTRHELHNDVPVGPNSKGSKRCDYHSFRRLYCSGLALAGVNIQQQMVMAGHRDAKTAMRYVKLAKQMLSAPSAAFPKDRDAGTTSGHNEVPAGTTGTTSGAGA